MSKTDVLSKKEKQKIEATIRYGVSVIRDMVAEETPGVFENVFSEETIQKISNAVLSADYEHRRKEEERRQKEREKWIKEQKRLYKEKGYYPSPVPILQKSVVPGGSGITCGLCFHAVEICECKKGKETKTKCPKCEAFLVRDKCGKVWCPTEQSHFLILEESPEPPYSKIAPGPKRSGDYGHYVEIGSAIGEKPTDLPCELCGHALETCECRDGEETEEKCQKCDAFLLRNKFNEVWCPTPGHFTGVATKEGVFVGRSSSDRF